MLMSNQTAVICNCCEGPCWFIATRCPGLTSGTSTAYVPCAQLLAYINDPTGSNPTPGPGPIITPNQVVVFSANNTCYQVSQASQQVSSLSGNTEVNFTAAPKLSSCADCTPVAVNCAGVFPPSCLTNYTVLFSGMDGCLSTGSTSCCCKVPNTVAVPVTWSSVQQRWIGNVTVGGVSVVCGTQNCNSNVNFNAILSCGSSGGLCSFTIEVVINSGIGGGGIFRKSPGPCVCPTGAYTTDPGSNGLRTCAASPSPNACHINPALFGTVSVLP